MTARVQITTFQRRIKKIKRQQDKTGKDDLFFPDAIKTDQECRDIDKNDENRTNDGQFSDQFVCHDFSEHRPAGRQKIEIFPEKTYQKTMNV